MFSSTVQGSMYKIWSSASNDSHRKRGLCANSGWTREAQSSHTFPAWPREQFLESRDSREAGPVHDVFKESSPSRKGTMKIQFLSCIFSSQVRIFYGVDFSLNKTPTASVVEGVVKILLRCLSSWLCLLYMYNTTAVSYWSIKKIDISHYT